MKNVMKKVTKKLNQQRKQSLRLLYLISLTLTVILFCTIIPTVKVIASQTTEIQQTQAQTLIEQGKTLYETGQYAAAADVLQQAITVYRNRADRLGEAVALSNLSLVYQQLGQWDEAESAIVVSLQILQPSKQHSEPDSASSVVAQAYDIWGRLQLSRGQADQALETWQQAAALYQQNNDRTGLIRSTIHQAEALQALGLYRRAIDLLDQLIADLTHQPEFSPALQIIALRSLGDALRSAGNLTRSETELQHSLELAQQLQQPETIAATQLSLAKTLAAQNNPQAALSLYQQAIVSGSSATQLQARLYQLRLLIETNPSAIPTSDLIHELTTQLDRLPPSHNTVNARVNLARSLMLLDKKQKEDTRNNAQLNTAQLDQTQLSAATIAQLLSTAKQQAQILGDQRAESFALGTLGELYEQAGQMADAQQVTEAALNLAQQIEAADTAYLWQWQLGRVLQAQGKREAAIEAYADAVATLQLLRSDLVAINPEVQLSFREGVEPVYRQFVSLLLQPDIALTRKELELARQTIESLQLAELDNFFREACLNAQSVLIDQVDQQAAVIYPIILPDRLEVILTLPQGGIRRYTVPVPQAEVTRKVTQLQAFLRQLASNNRAVTLSEQIYDWLIRPIQPDLNQNAPSTLVFVLDGVLRNIPMAVLRDRETGQYLIEQYAIALTPGLQLLESQNAGAGQFGVLLGGLSQSPSPEFSNLPGVVDELEQIRSQVDSNRLLLNSQFNENAIRDAIQKIPFPVVHLATHGEFSSRLEDTFILTWDNRITINQLNSLLQATDISRRRPIELLVLSACETAEGDERAALGLAGVAVRAGARSTIASLWPLNDAAAPQLMVQFYQNLANGNVTKAEALRQAQLSLLQSQYSQPYYWGAVVLVGNWQQL